MEDRSQGTSEPGAQSRTRHEDRGVWVLTAYGVSGLTLFGILIYYFSNYVTR